MKTIDIARKVEMEIPLSGIRTVSLTHFIQVNGVDAIKESLLAS
jgi:hypothetical protein